MKFRRLAQAALLAAALALVFATHVFTAYQPIRLRIVLSSLAASRGEVRVPVSSSFDTGGLRVPFAVVWRARNRSESSVNLILSLDGQRICDRLVGPGPAKRLDCDVERDWSAGREHELSVTGPDASWSLDYLELATQHGGDQGVIVFPAASTAIERPHALAIGFVWLILTLLFLVPTPSNRRRVLVGVHRVISWVFAAAMILALASTAVTSYSVVLSSFVFFKWTAFICAWPLVAIWRSLMSRFHAVGATEPRSRRSKATSNALGVALGVLLVYGGVASSILGEFYRGDYSGFLHISEQWVDRNPILRTRDDVRRTLDLHDDGGYDGQFMYFATFDPFMRLFRNDVRQYRDVVDAPPYRFGRIGFPLMAKLVSFDRWEWYPAVMVWSILLGLGACAFLLSAIAQRQTAHPMWGAVILLVPGFWQSVQLGLPEPIAAALVLGGVWCLLSERPLTAGILFGLSALFRETGVIFALCLAAAMFLSGRRRTAFLFAIFAMAPIVIWRIYVGATLYGDFGLQAYFFDPGDLTMPFAGIVDLWRRVAAGTYYPGNHQLARAAVTYPLLLTFGLLMIVASAIRRISAIAIAGTIYGLLAVSLNYRMIWVHVGNGQRGTFELFIALALVSVVRSEAQWFRWVRNAFWVAAAAYVFFGAYDASYLRSDLRDALSLIL